MAEAEKPAATAPLPRAISHPKRLTSTGTRTVENTPLKFPNIFITPPDAPALPWPISVEVEHGIPTTIKSQVAAEAENAIANGAIVGDKAQRPDFRMKYAIRVGCLYIVNAGFQESDQRLLYGRQSNLPGLTEDCKSIPVTP